MQSLIVKLIAITTTLVSVTAVQLDSESQVDAQSTSGCTALTSSVACLFDIEGAIEGAVLTRQHFDCAV